MQSFEVFAIRPIIGHQGYALKLPLVLTPVLGLRARSSAFWLGSLVLVTCLGVSLSVFYFADQPKTRPVSPVLKVALTPRHLSEAPIQDSMPNAQMPVDLYKFALNAFLVPLLDDNIPPKWTYVAVDFMCDVGTTVMVDGEPMVSGQPIPVKAFIVRWEMDHCLPFGRGSVELTGSVEMVVARNAKGLSATVTPIAMRVDSFNGRTWLRGPFRAETAVDTVAPTQRLKTSKPQLPDTPRYK